jgi:broad specificity phosphatase PhoE
MMLANERPTVNNFLKSLMPLCVLLLLSLSAMLSAGNKSIPKAEREQLVILVRHAEKALDQGEDPALTEVGQARARDLHAALAHMQVGAIVTTQWQRTRATAAPLAKALNIEPMVIDTQSSDTNAHVRAVADTVRAQSAKVVLVVGHSNTVPAIITALGGPEVAALGDNDYDNLYLLWRSSEKVRFLYARY